MRHKIAQAVLASFFATVVTVGVASPAHAEDHPCSLERAAGKWSFTDSGTVVGIGPRTAVGIFTLDEAGNVRNGVATSSLNGSVANETFSGTYTVNPDCTGSISVKIYAAGAEILAVTLNLAFDGGVKHVRGIFTSVTAPNGTILPTIINLEAKRQ